MSDQNIALLNTIDAIDDATMETEMEVLVSMESYYEIRYLDAELTAEEYSKKIERRDDL